MTVLAHGGLGGALVEVGAIVSLLALFLGVWLKGRREADDEADEAGED